MIRLWLGLIVIAACGGSTTPAHTTPPPANDPSCPVEVPGTSVTVDDSNDGASFVFVTTGDVAAVRERAKFLALAYARRQLGGESAGHDHEMSDMIATPSTAEETSIDRGARVTFKATRPEDVAALQSELRMHAQHLAAGSCEMAM